MSKFASIDGDSPNRLMIVRQVLRIKGTQLAGCLEANVTIGTRIKVADHEVIVLGILYEPDLSRIINSASKGQNVVPNFGMPNSEIFGKFAVIREPDRLPRRPTSVKHDDFQKNFEKGLINRSVNTILMMSFPGRTTKVIPE